MGIEDDREAALRVHRELNSLGIRRTRQARQVSQPRQPSPPKKQSRDAKFTSDDGDSSSSSEAYSSYDSDEVSKATETPKPSEKLEVSVTKVAKTPKKSSGRANQKPEGKAKARLPPKPSGTTHDPKRKAGDSGGRKQEAGPDQRPKPTPAAPGKSSKVLSKQGTTKQPTQPALKRAHSAAQGDPGHEGLKRKLSKTVSMPLTGAAPRGKQEIARGGHLGTNSPTNQPRKSSVSAFACTPQPLTLHGEPSSAKVTAKGSSAAIAHATSPRKRAKTPATRSELVPAVKDEHPVCHKPASSAAGLRPTPHVPSALPAYQGLEDVCEEAKQSAKLTLCRERLSEKCIPKGYVKCFMKGVAYGIWLQPSDLRTRAQLAAAITKQYDSTVQIAKDGRSLDVIFIDREEDTHICNGRTEAGHDSAENDKAWAQSAQKAVVVLVSNDATI